MTEIVYTGGAHPKFEICCILKIRQSVILRHILYPNETRALQNCVCEMFVLT